MPAPSSFNTKLKLSVKFKRVSASCGVLSANAQTEIDEQRIVNITNAVLCFFFSAGIINDKAPKIIGRKIGTIKNKLFISKTSYKIDVSIPFVATEKIPPATAITVKTIIGITISNGSRTFTSVLSSDFSKNALIEIERR